MKIYWHEVLVNYYMYHYNHCTDKQEEKRSKLIKKAFYHQDKILEIKCYKHNNVAAENILERRHHLNESLMLTDNPLFLIKIVPA